MKRFSIIISFVFSLVACSPVRVNAENNKPRTIPLNEIWAYQMPGTKDVRELEPKLDVHDPNFKELWERSLVRGIASYLSTYVPDRGELAGPAFIVVGTGKEALKNAHAELVKDRGATRNSNVSANTELTLVFYSYVTGWHLRLKSIEKSPSVVTIKYQFVAPREPAFAATRFALVPIGKLTKGEVKVEVEQLPPVDYAGRAMPPKRDADRFVCGSFSFEVR